MKKKKLGEVLRERGKISQSDLTRAIAEQEGKVVRLGELMLTRGLVQKPDLIAALAEVSPVPYADCTGELIEPEVLRLIPRALAERCCVLPLKREGPRLVAVMAEPQNLSVQDELRFTCGLEISPRFGFRAEIQAAIEKNYGDQEQTQDRLQGEESAVSEEADGGSEMEFVSTSSRQSNQEAMKEVQAELYHQRSPAVRLVAEIISAALAKGASDIHIEPQAADTAVRIRVDGVLRDLQRVPRALQNSLTSRIKIVSDMDIAERRAPQDGRFQVKMRGKKLDLRVSTLPTQYGEKVVMRLLEPDAPLVSFSQLGLDSNMEKALLRILAMPQGMLLVTGPTGSGKSTTLYAALNVLRKPAVNIITVEDPVEYVLAGINQVHVNTKAGLTFASCLRSILRQDPNIIMVGEIRDKETAEIAMKAAQTGHLVLSTLHTNDSIAAVTRLLDLGLPGFLIANSVTGIIAQRLVRRLCSCRDQIAVTPEAAARMIDAGLGESATVQCIPGGCALCDFIGYKGRVGIYEMLVFDESVRNAVRAGGRNDEIRNLACAGGTRLMYQYALDQVKSGVTTLDEVLRVVPFEKISTPACPQCGRDLGPSFLYCPYCGSKKAVDLSAARPGIPELVRSR